MSVRILFPFFDLCHQITSSQGTHGKFILTANSKTLPLRLLRRGVTEPKRKVLQSWVS